LGLFDLSTGQIEEWQVYPEASSEEECAPHDKSKSVLEAAKAALKTAGLDIAKKPAGKDIGDSDLVVNGANYSVQNQDGRSPKDPLFVEVFGSDEENAGVLAVTQMEVMVNGAVKYRIREEYETMMAGSLKIQAASAFDVGEGVVILMEHQFFSGRGVGNGYSFSPVLK